MEYQSIILELIARVQKLEEEVKELKDRAGEPKNKKITTEDIKAHIKEMISLCEGDSLVVISGNVHRELPIKNSMPMVCNAMYAVMTDGDEILEHSPSGYSSTLKIKYKKRSK